MIDKALGGVIVCKLFLCARLVDCYNGKWLTTYWVVEKAVSYYDVLYLSTIIWQMAY
jgi:hypothetical protein